MRNLLATCLLASFALTLPACAVSNDAKPELELEELGQTTQAFTERLTLRLQELGTPALADLEALYATGTNDGVFPEGRAVGRAFFTGLPGFAEVEEQLRRAGWPTARTVEDFLANVIWRGKTFHPVHGEADRVGMLTNDIFGLHFATADIRRIGESENPDEANTFYLDYSRSNLFVVRGVQDYIRKIGPGLYIGKAFIKLPGGDRVLGCYFALDFVK